MPLCAKHLALLALALVCGQAALSADGALTWRFNTPGDLLGWRPEGYKEISVAGGAIRGLTAKLSFLYSPVLNLDAATHRVFVFTARVSHEGSGRIYFRRPGETFSEDRGVSFVITGDKRLRSYAVNMGDNANWAGRIEQARFDIVYVADARVEISRMGFATALPDEKNANLIANGDFENTSLEDVHLPEDWHVSATPGGSFELTSTRDGGAVAGAFAPLQTAERRAASSAAEDTTRRHSSRPSRASGSNDRTAGARLSLRKPDAKVAARQHVDYDDMGGYEIALDYKTSGMEHGELAIALGFVDIFGNPLPNDLRYSLPTPPSTEWQKFTTSFLLPNEAASGEVELLATARSAGGEILLDNIRLSHVPSAGTGRRELNASKPSPTTGAGTTAVEKDGAPMSPPTTRPLDGPVRNPTAAVRLSSGVPTVIINGQAHTTMNYWVDLTTTSGLIANCRDNGIHLYMLNVSDIPWTPPDKYDFSRVDAICCSLLLQDPDAYFVLAIALDDINSFGKVLKNWTGVYPDQRVLNSEASPDIPHYGGAIGNAPSMASPRWQQTAEDLVRKLIRHVRHNRYGERIIGYLPATGVTFEWQQWASVAAPPVFVDYSEPARLAFIEWVRHAYADISALNAAWKASHGSFGDITIPSKEQRIRSDLGVFLDPKKSKREIDYRRYYSEQVANVILRLARAIKEETHGESLCGVYYGYVTHVLGPYRYQLIGHSALHKILESPEVDFLMSPSDYGDRQIGGGSGLISVTDSVKLHGKAWVDQADLRTYRSSQNIGRLASLSDSKAGWIRHFGNALVSGSCEQIYDFSQGWTSGDPRLMRLMGRMRDIEERMMRVSRNVDCASDSIAVIVDEKSTCYTAMASSIHLDTVTAQLPALCRTGVGFDTYLLDDLSEMPPYKCYLFLNTFRITRQQQAYIDKHLKTNGKTLIFVYAPGITDGNRILPERVSAITGIDLDVVSQELPLAVVLAATSHPVLKYCGDGDGYGAGNKYGPLFVAKNAESLGFLRGYPDKPSLAIKRNPAWTCVFSAAPGLPAELLRGIAEDAGVRVTNPTDGDITFVGDRLIVVHTATGGHRTLRCAVGTTQVEELVTGRTYPVKDGVFMLDLPARSTSIFFQRSGHGEQAAPSRPAE